MGRKREEAIFQFFDYFRLFLWWIVAVVLYKKKLIYANLFFTMIGDKKSGTLQTDKRNAHVA